MTTATISFARNNLSALLRKVRAGEEVLILDRKEPVARLSAVPPDETDWKERLHSLIQQGMVRPARNPRRIQEILALPIGRPAPGTDALAALRIDREEGG